MRTFLIAGNWKMNYGPNETRSFFTELSGHTSAVSAGTEVLVCAPFLSIGVAIDSARRVQGVQVGAQNVHFEDNGAYTGEISTSMLKEVGCHYVIIGHSERREYFGETDDIVNKKVTKVLAGGLSPILCVGEVLPERKENKQNEVVKAQLIKNLESVSIEALKKVVIAYEPVWAIGTGETASPEQAQEMHAFIRSVLAELYNDDVAQKVRILYGGSMKPDNAEELLSQNDVDGGLIGGASLKADSFYAIVEIANKLTS